jgi:putative heme-binding domain-containing protein
MPYHLRILFTGCAIPFLFSASPVAGAQPTATPVDRFQIAGDFQAELVYEVPREEQGSWVALTVDDRGRLITSDQYGKLYRIIPKGLDGATETRVEAISANVGMAHGLLYAFDSLYVMVNEGRRRLTPGLYRVRDTNGDDQFDDVKLLREIKGGGEHGPHAVVLGPDGKSIYVCAGNHTELAEMEKSLVPRNWQEDLLLPRMWDAGGHAVDILAPGGWIARTDPEGKEFELVSIGYRNQYDVAFNAEGELFTYDSDMEWDIGTSWYRPTRVNHATSGSDFGWRSGTGNSPEYYADNLGAVVNVGPGSPTGITFGTGAKFPERYQRALFLCDWSYGIIYAVHLDSAGASYTGTLERFLSASALPVTDVLINPRDGALYFTVGGRRTHSALYRVTYAGSEDTSPAAVGQDSGTELRRLRREIEELHSAEQGDESAVVKVWPFLNHEDRAIRYAARVALEKQPVRSWLNLALSEDHPWASINSLLALARNAEPTVRPDIVKSLCRLSWDDLDRDQKLGVLRLYEILLSRMGRPSPEEREAVLAQLDKYFPADDADLNRELSQVLLYLEAPNVVRRTLDLLAKAPTQEEQTHYALILRTVQSGWTLEDRKEYFDWFQRVASGRGGMSFGGFLRNIRTEAIEALTTEDRQALRELLAATPAREEVVTKPDRPFVREWTVADLVPAVESRWQGRSLERGRDLFAQALCFRCHRFAGQGGISGPDLTAAGGRFSVHDLLESLIEPSKVVSDQYQATIFVLDNGTTVEGKVINLAGDRMMVLTNMFDPSSLANVSVDRIEESRPSTISMMPQGLLDTLTEEEVADLVAYLISGGNPRHDVYQ